MRATQILSLTALAASLAAGFAFVPAFARDGTADTRVETNARLPVLEVRQRLSALGYKDIERIEPESGEYEVRARSSSGERVKLHVDARSGEVVRTKARAHEGEGRVGRSHVEARGATQDCTERRCRDDRGQPLKSEKLGWYLSDIYGRMAAAGI
ncbi:MAG: PepSY domain-containing protein [Betaproteobacteria bacterium]|nr:MAG: PepSY domain-containing protein [Betaproteobacteria bacterium]